MENTIKIIISGLDNAGKTSILTALDRKYNFQKEIMELKPTIKVEYHHTTFLGNSVSFFDMGGQKVYRDLYQKRKDFYFAGTDLIVHIIDIQDKDRFEDSLNYLGAILEYFEESEMPVPLIISFHKYDPKLRGNEVLVNNITELREKIVKKHHSFKILFQQTSIYDLISIVQLVSYGLSVFDGAFFELSTLLEEYIDILQCSSLILFDQNGIIISEFYSYELDPMLYIELLQSIKEHLVLLKKKQEENLKLDSDFFTLNSYGKLLSYIHEIKYNKEPYYLSFLVEEDKKEGLLEKLSTLISEIIKIFNELFS